MGFAIPKLQYKNGSTTGGITNGSGTIDNVGDTSEIEAGMFIRGTGIPTGALVESVTTTSILIASSVVATTTNSSVDLTFGFEIEFDYPPIEPKGEELETKSSSSESLSGIKQVSVNHIEATRQLSFSHLSPAKYALVDTWLRDDALNGETFRYFEDKTLSSYVEYELDNLKVSPKKIAPRGVDTYVWEVPLKFRRVL